MAIFTRAWQPCGIDISRVKNRHYLMINKYEWIYLINLVFHFFFEGHVLFEKILISRTNAMFTFKVIFFEQIDLRISHIKLFFLHALVQHVASFFHLRTAVITDVTFEWLFPFMEWCNMSIHVPLVRTVIVIKFTF